MADVDAAVPAPSMLARPDQPRPPLDVGADPGKDADVNGTVSPGTVTLTAGQFTHLLSLVHVQSARALSQLLSRTIPPPLTRARSCPLPAPPYPRAYPHPFPPFSSRTHASVVGRPLPELFPTVEPSILLDITRHAFDPTELYKLDDNYCQRVPHVHSDSDPLADVGDPHVRDFLDHTTFPALTPREYITRFYPSFSSLFVPLSTYFRILLAFAASSGDVDATVHVASTTKEYLARLVSFNEEYHWSIVLSFHMAFHAHRIEEMRRGEYGGWAEPDLSLLVMFLGEEEHNEEHRDTEEAAASQR